MPWAAAVAVGSRSKRAERGRPRVWCSQTCRELAYRDRHPLGWRAMQALGVEDHRPMRMLRARGVVDDSALRQVDAYVRSRRRVS
jgi:hypothetical protein